MFKLICKVIGHKWGRWHDSVYQGKIRVCLNCGETEYKEIKK